jgi:hypothetical protein
LTAGRYSVPVETLTGIFNHARIRVMGPLFLLNWRRTCFVFWCFTGSSSNEETNYQQDHGRDYAAPEMKVS